MINTASSISLAVNFLIVYHVVVALFYNESYNLVSKKDSPGTPTYVFRPEVHRRRELSELRGTGMTMAR